jgi:hypothetical protein
MGGTVTIPTDLFLRITNAAEAYHRRLEAERKLRAYEKSLRDYERRYPCDGK